MVSLRVTYTSAAELLRDIESQLAHGGLLVKIPDAASTADLTLHDPASVDLVAPDGQQVRCQGQILHVQAGHGVAVSVPAEAVAEVRRIARALPPDGAPGGPPDGSPDGSPDASAKGPAKGPALHERVADAAAPPAAADRPGPATTAPARSEAERRASAASATSPAGPSAPNKGDKIQQALHGNKDERAAILRDKNKMLYPYVLRNPQITAEEILAIAKNPLMNAELLTQIADRKEWLQKPTIAVALSRNPKTPPGAGLRALEFVAAADLRQMAKGIGAPPHIVTAARKKVVG